MTEGKGGEARSTQRTALGRKLSAEEELFVGQEIGSRTYVQTDPDRLARDGPSFTIANCWSHARRGFIEAESAYPKAREMVERIGELYAVEARAGRVSTWASCTARSRR